MMAALQEWIDVLMGLLEEHMKELPLEKQDALKKAGGVVGLKLSSCENY